MVDILASDMLHIDGERADVQFIDGKDIDGKVFHH